MEKNYRIFLAHILESINWIEKDTRGFKKADFLQNRTIQDAVARRLEIIGEAVRNLPLDWREKSRQIPWGKITGMRDFLIHEYFGVDLDLV